MKRYQSFSRLLPTFIAIMLMLTVTSSDGAFVEVITIHNNESLVASPPSVNPLSEFMSACNDTSSCNVTKGLTCSFGVCKCINPETMYFDEKNASCKVLAGKPCYVENPVSLTMKGDVSALLEAPSEKQLACRMGTKCDVASKLCICENPRETESKFGTCIKKAIYGNQCSSKKDCREDLGLTCKDNKCICCPDKTNPVYGHDGNVISCAGKVGEPCVNGDCTSNTVCEESNLKPEQNQTDAPSAPALNVNGSKEGLCKCIPETFPTKDGLCSKNHGIICNHTNQCPDGLECVEGACGCPLDRIFLPDLDTCAAKVGATCNQNHTYSEPFPFPGLNNVTICIAGADCVLDPSISVLDFQTGKLANKYHCQCNSMFDPTDDGHCNLESTEGWFSSMKWYITAASSAFILLLFIFFVYYLIKTQYRVVNALN